MLITRGNAVRMGCEKCGSSYNFAFASEYNEVSLLIFDNKKSLKYRVDMDKTFKTGNVFACAISGEKLDKAYYCYEVNGRKVIDPYAKTVTDCELFGIVKKDALYLSRIVLEDFDWEGDKPLNLPYEECIFYKIHTRGFTKSKNSKVKDKGTFAGIIHKIPYLKELGITTVELMPSYEFDENMRFEQLQKSVGEGLYASFPVRTPINYWGYNEALHFAPKAAYTSIAGSRSDYTSEFKSLVKELHKNGIELVMEMYFKDETPGLILDCIHYWVTQYHIDGVHLYAPKEALTAAASSPLLSDTKIITVCWDRTCKMNKNQADYNASFSKTARCFLKGDENQLSEFANAAKNNPYDMSVVNFITNHNGFTLSDLVSYDRKHNEENGESNRDGESFNYSWNCGAEGKTRKKSVAALRQKQIKNAFMLLLLSAGTPLIMSGDEFKNSQCGNNNPYCLDNEISWVNWNTDSAAQEIFCFVKSLIKFRKNCKILHMKNSLISSDMESCGYPDISYHGTNAWYQTMESYDRHIAIMYCTKYDKIVKSGYELIYVAYNMHWETHMLALPKLPSGCVWEFVLSSGTEADVIIQEGKEVKIAPRTIAVVRAYIRQKNDKECGVRSANKKE